MTVSSELEKQVYSDFNLHDDAFQIDPYPIYEQLRLKPICKVMPEDMWVVSRYVDVKQVLSNPAAFSSKALDILYDSDWLSGECRNPRLIASQDPPQHGQYRGVVNRAFINSAIEYLIPLMKSTAEKLAVKFESSDSINFMEEFAYPYIGTVITHIVGVGDKQELADFREWVALEEGVSLSKPSAEYIKAFERATLRQSKYFLQAAQERRVKPQADLVTHLVNAQVNGEKLKDKELCSILSLLVAAGFVTTIQMLNHGIMIFSQRPDLVADLKQSPELIPQFVEELLRFRPTTISTVRLATRPVEINGVTIPKGDLVLALLSSAGRDPERFDDPNTFNLHRRGVKQHMSFGHGIHTCVGAPLARLELKIAFEVLLKKFSSFDCPPDKDLRWLDSVFLRGVRELPVYFSKV